jgi:tungstate transport system substrate-binding protein
MARPRPLIIVLALLLVACGSAATTATPTATAAGAAAPTSAGPAAAGERQVLRLATTTSTADSGLLEAILPDFEQQHNAKVEVVAVGTGQALKLGENGDADVVLVHARAREDQFVAAGFGLNRRDVMYNDFIIVGPSADPAGIKDMTTAADALRAIAATGSTFASRGDDSGTHTKEISLWASIGMTPTAELGGYKSLGQGMGETLITANEQQAYTLADRGTYLAMHDRLPELALLVGGDSIELNKDRALLNPYGVIPVNPAKHPGINAALAEQFAAWMVSPEAQASIGAFGKDQFGQPLFFPGKAP